MSINVDVFLIEAFCVQRGRSH